jgi:predicted acetyltransferase
MQDLNFREANHDDLALLAEMNQQLILDEGSHNSMALEQLFERMRGWLQADRHAVIIEHGDNVIGYMLYYQISDEYFPYQDSIYVRQFFIQASYRRRGIGKIAFDRIASEYFPPNKAIMLDVLESNPEAKQFWLKLGFEMYNVTLRRQPVNDQAD